MVESEKAERQRKEDREAKDRARRSKGESKGPRSPGRSDRERRDSRSKARARGSGGAASAPGAVAEKSNREDRGLSRSSRSSRDTRERSDRDAKERARKGRSNREQKPGAVSASNDSESREARKMRRHGSKSGSSRGHRSGDRDADREAKKRAKMGSSGSATPGASSSSKSDRRIREKMESEPDSTKVDIQESGDGEIQLNAVAVEDAENEELKEQRAQIEKLKQQMQTMAQPNHVSEPNEDGDGDEGSANNEQPAKNRWKCIVVVVVLLAIGGGVAGYILGTAKSPEGPPPLTGEATSPPTLAGSNTTAAPLPITTSPSNSPTELQLYTPPSKEDCDLIAAGSTLPDQDTLTSKEFAIEFDATVSFQMAEEVWRDSLKKNLQSIFLPAVAGCTTRRWLRETTTTKQDRQLQLLPDFAIANGKVGGATVTEGGCEDKSAPLCFRVSVLMDLSLRDEDARLSFVEAYLIITLGASPVNFLGLDTLLTNLAVIRAPPTTLTDEPSFNPSSGPTTVQPTDSPSAKPSFAPVAGPTTVEPTRSPTKAPTIAPVAAPILVTENPTASPSKAPVIAPTLAPVVGPTPPPTQSPTKNPTQPPTPSPTPLPTPGPTLSTPAPSMSLSSMPTLSTPAPSIAASSSPTPVPTTLASDNPTAAPSPSPTVQDSQSPTALQTVITASATTEQSSPFECSSSICLANGDFKVPTGEASLAIDGNTDGEYMSGTSAHTYENQWNPYWQVEGITGPVSTVRIWNRSGQLTGALVGVNVDLLDSGGVVLATREIQGVAASWELDFGSVSGVATVRLARSGYGYLAIPEVEVLDSSGNSLLTGSSVASQSSNLSCRICLFTGGFGTAGVSSLAIDGNTNGNFQDGSVIHTMTQVDPWWQVDLQLTATVSRVIIWNRTDCCGDLLVGANIYLKDASGNILHTETVTSSGATSTFDFAPVASVTAIRVARENTAPSQVTLHFAEIEAFGIIQ